jgi:citrate synthase
MSSIVNQKISDVFDVENNLGHTVLIPKKEVENYFIYDKGMRKTAICKSSLCYVDMRNGKFYIRGKETILSKNHDFLDFAFDVIFAENNQHDKKNFLSAAQKYFTVFPEVRRVLWNLDRNIDPMDFLAIGILSLAPIVNKYLQANNRQELAGLIIAQTSIIAGSYYHLQNNQEVSALWQEQSFTQNVIRYFHPLQSEQNINQWATILNTMLILHCEHGMNCSAATVRNVASAHSDIFSAISAGIAAFKGNLHGGASRQVSQMYDSLIASNASPKNYIEQIIKDKQPLMGFGQRTYNQIANCYDPRVLAMKEILQDEQFDFTAIKEYKKLCFEFIEHAQSLEFFKQRNLTPNPDLFYCIFYKLFQVPSPMNPVMISLGRIVGWIANYYEHYDQKYPLSRPCDFGAE